MSWRCWGAFEVDGGAPRAVGEHQGRTDSPSRLRAMARGGDETTTRQILADDRHGRVEVPRATCQPHRLGDAGRLGGRGRRARDRRCKGGTPVGVVSSVGRGDGRHWARSVRGSRQYAAAVRCVPRRGTGGTVLGAPLHAVLMVALVWGWWPRTACHPLRSPDAQPLRPGCGGRSRPVGSRRMHGAIPRS